MACHFVAVGAAVVAVVRRLSGAVQSFDRPDGRNLPPDPIQAYLTATGYSTARTSYTVPTTAEQ